MPRLGQRPVPVATTAASAMIATGLLGALVDNNGRIGLVLFIAGAASLAFLGGRASAPVIRSLRRESMPRLVGTRVVVVLVMGAGVLLAAANFFKATDDRLAVRVVNYVSFAGALALGICLAGLAAATVIVWLRASAAPSD